MGYTLSELRAIAEGTSEFDHMMTMDEAASMYALDEAFFGKKPVAKIQAAMDKIYDAVMKDPNINLQSSPLSKNLEDAFCDVFGFKSCSIYWANREGLSNLAGNIGSNGPCTIPRAAFLHSGENSFVYGTHKNGFYDNEHTLKVYINTDQTLFTVGGMTSAEVTAILLHEVGHNFDYSLFTVMMQWYNVCNALLNVMMNPTNQRAISKAISVGSTVAIREFGGGVFQTLSNLDDIVMNTIPPIRTLLRMAGKIKFNLMKIINALFSLVKIPLLPIYIVMSPLMYLKNIGTRKGEVYSDSFAASYGYSEELASALQKLDQYMYADKNANMTFLTPFYDLTLLQAEIIQTCSGGHGSTQQRTLRMIDKLNQDLRDSDLNAADRKAIQDELKRLTDTYDRYVNADEDTRKTMSNTFRKMVDNWYNGKNYMVIPNLLPDQQYAR